MSHRNHNYVNLISPSPFLSLDNLASVQFDIDNFDTQTYRESSLFTFPSSSVDSRIKLQLLCFPNSDISFLDIKYTLVYLYLFSCDQPSLNVRYRISILNSNGVKCEMQEGVAKLIKGDLNNKNWRFLINRAYLLNPANGLLLNGKIRFYCEVEKTREEPNDSSNFESNLTRIPHNSILEDLQSLLEDGTFSDLILSVGAKKDFHVHKAILVTRSKVFAAMFEHDCVEKLRNRVELSDISVEACDLMLRYIYTGKVELAEQNVCELFAAADKYQLDHLKALCERHLSFSLSIHSVANILLLADMHQALELKAECIDYITDNVTRVMATEGWKTLTSNRIELTIELLKELAIKTNR